MQGVANAYTLIFGVLIVTGSRLSDILGRRRMFFLGAGIFAAFSAVAAAVLAGPRRQGRDRRRPPARRLRDRQRLRAAARRLPHRRPQLALDPRPQHPDRRHLLAGGAGPARADKAAAVKERLDYAGVALLAVALGAMGAVQRRVGERALVPRDVIANPIFAAACLTTMLASGTWFALLLYGPQFMQKVLGFSPLESGIGFLPLMIVYTLTSFAAGPLYNPIGGRVPLLLGAAGLALGALLLSRLGADSAYTAMLPGLAVLGVGVGLFYSTLTNLAITSLDPARSSVGGGGLLFMFQLVGGAIGVVLTTTVFFGAGGKLAGATAVGELSDAAREAFVDGFQAGLRVDAALGLTALLVVRKRASA